MNSKRVRGAWLVTPEAILGATFPGKTSGGNHKDARARPGYTGPADEKRPPQEGGDKQRRRPATLFLPRQQTVQVKLCGVIRGQTAMQDSRGFVSAPRAACTKHVGLSLPGTTATFRGDMLSASLML